MPFVADLGPTLLAVGTAILVLPLLDRERTAGRAVPCFLCIALMGRTLIWRLTDTLPPFTLTLEALWAYSFVALEVLSTISSMLLFFFLSRTINRDADSRRHAAWVAHEQPRVDILIATLNEERSILERTIIGALAQDYGNFRVHVLDDGRREWLRALCARRGAGYITRADNAHAKSGNINHALHVLTERGDPGEFVAILDADFVAQPDFLKRALALFHDPQVGCVQTPQHFFNPDPLQHGFKSAQRWPDEQRFFFDVLLASKDAWNVAFCCGTSSISRRRALDEVGGFPVESITEDMLLSLKLKARAWKTVYLNERLSMGLAPEGVGEYITQRRRWCLGFMQIARSAFGPFGSAPLPLIDRLSLMDAFLYWGLSFPFRIFCLAAPVVYGLTGIAVIRADATAVLAHYGPSICTAVIVLGWITRGRVLPIITDAGQLIITYDAMEAALVGLLQPKGHRFSVTPKGGDRSRIVVQWRLMLRFAIPLAIVLGTVAYGTQFEFSPIYGDRSAPIWLFWSYYNALVIFVTAVTCIELPRQQVENFHADEPAWLTIGGHTRQHRLLLLSPAGATLSGAIEAAEGAPIDIRLHQIEAPIAARLVQRGKHSSRIEFSASPAADDALTLKLFSGHYHVRPHDFRFADVVTAITARAMT